MSALTEELHRVGQELEGNRTSLDGIDSRITRREKILKDKGIVLGRPENSSDGFVFLSRNVCFYTTNLFLLMLAVAFLLYILTGLPVDDKPSMLVL